jgi:hypothetical protein
MLVFRLIAMFTMLVVGIWLLSHVFQALRRRVANAGGLTIPYKTRPVFFIITILVQLAFGVLILWTVGNILNDILADTNRSRGQGIVNAIYAYEHRTHSFPGSLHELTPGFLQRAPETVNGQDFFYSVDPVHEFNLSYPESAHFGCGFTDQSQRWECGWGD